jgi:hypothetical protein
MVEAKETTRSWRFLETGKQISLLTTNRILLDGAFLKDTLAPVGAIPPPFSLIQL